MTDLTPEKLAAIKDAAQWAVDGAERIGDYDPQTVIAMADEIERLREFERRVSPDPAEARHYWEARYRDEAAENERLRARVAELEAALEPFAEAESYTSERVPDNSSIAQLTVLGLCIGDIRKARNVLKGSEG